MLQPTLTLVAYEMDADSIFLLSRGKGLEKLGLQPDEMIGASVFDIDAQFPEVIKMAQMALAGNKMQAKVEVADVVWDANFIPIDCQSCG
jgi:hypothetical protein